MYFLGLGSVWGSRSLTQSTIEREVNSQLTQVSLNLFPNNYAILYE
jgi:hypothetical protein